MAHFSFLRQRLRPWPVQHAAFSSGTTVLTPLRCVITVGLRSRLRPYCLLAFDGNSGKPKAEVVEPVDRQAPEAVRRAAELGFDAPAAAPAHPARGPRRI